MNPEDDLDALLACADGDELPAGDVFVRAVLARVDQGRRRRRIVLAAVAGAITAAACAAWIALPIQAPVEVLGGPINSITVLALVALCGLVWIDTEGTPMRVGRR